jgi:hypothetical protein
MTGAYVTILGLLPAPLFLALVCGETLRLRRRSEMLGGPGLVVGGEASPDRRHLVFGVGDLPGEPGDLLPQLLGPFDLISTLRI